METIIGPDLTLEASLAPWKLLVVRWEVRDLDGNELVEYPWTEDLAWQVIPEWLYLEREPVLRYEGGVLDFMHAREYDWRLGRFTAPDPAGSSWNTYAYVLGNPVNFTDPEGLRAVVGEGWGDQARNVAMAGSTETAWGWLFESIPISPSYAGVAHSPRGYFLAVVPRIGLVILDDNLKEIQGASIPASLWERVAVTIFRAPGVFPTMKEIFKKAGYGNNLTERGAIIYLGGAGNLWAFEVPWSHTYRKQSIPLTATTLATAHTHPTQGKDTPSNLGDIPSGKRLKLLMYVLHRRRVTVYVPWTDKVLTIAGSRWWEGGE